MKDQSFGCPSSATTDLSELSDVAIVAEVVSRAARERQATADLIRVLIEFDRRRLYLGEGYSSLYAYCTSALNYSEHAAFNRIEVARAAARWPQLLSCLEDGSLHLAGARLLAPHLTAENIDMALASARHKSKREIEDVAAGLARRALLVAVAAEQYRLHLTISRSTRDKLRQIQALLSHQLPDGNPAVIFDRALELLLKELERRRLAATDHPRKDRPSAQRSRHIPAAVKREVWKRDEGRCAFVGRQGRCTERNFLEYHHVVPHSEGGPPTAANIELRCRAHNAYEAETYFGPEVVEEARRRKQMTKIDVGDELPNAASTVLSSASHAGSEFRECDPVATAESERTGEGSGPGRGPEHAPGRVRRRGRARQSPVPVERERLSSSSKERSDSEPLR